jgi:hypothetical protein
MVHKLQTTDSSDTVRTSFATLPPPCTNIFTTGHRHGTHPHARTCLGTDRHCRSTGTRKGVEIHNQARKATDRHGSARTEVESAGTHAGEHRKAADRSRKCLTALTTFPRPLELVVVAVVNVDHVRVRATHVPVRQDHITSVRFAPITPFRRHIPIFRFCGVKLWLWPRQAR